MVGGLARKTAPRDLARDPESWPDSAVDDVAARVVQAIARELAGALEREKRSLRQVSTGSGVNRQTISDLLAGRCWPDVVTVARLEDFLAVPLYPQDGMRSTHQNRPSRPQGNPPQGTTK